MKALVYEGPKIMKMRDLEDPVPNQTEVLIRVEVAGICGSELSGYLGHNALRKPPLIMGHEFSGTIEHVGHHVTRFAKGDRVTANPLISCGNCRDCTNGAAQLCAHRQLIGAHRPGAFAEYVVVPERNVYKLNDHVSFDSGAIVEPFACAVHICKLLEPIPTDRLLIMGAGPIGILVLKAAKIYGVDQITVIDINESRLEIARELGGTTATNLEALGVDGTTFDAAVDAVGLEVTRTHSIESVKPGGKVIFTGLHEESSSLPVNLLIRNEIKAMGAFAYHSDDFERALHWIGQGRVDLSPWTIYEDLENGGESFEKLISNPGKVAKILLSQQHE